LTTVVMRGTYSTAVVFVYEQIGSVTWAYDVMDYRCWLQATYAVNHSLTDWMLPQEPSLKPNPKASLVQLTDFIAASAFVDVLFVLRCVLWAISLAVA